MPRGKPESKEVEYTQYTPECPICRGVLLPEKVEELEAEVDRLKAQVVQWRDHATIGDETKDRLKAELAREKVAADQWRDLYMARQE